MKHLEHFYVVLSQHVITGVVKQVEIQVIIGLEARYEHVFLVLYLHGGRIEVDNCFN